MSVLPWITFSRISAYLQTVARLQRNHMQLQNTDGVAGAFPLQHGCDAVPSLRCAVSECLRACVRMHACVCECPRARV